MTLFLDTGLGLKISVAKKCKFFEMGQRNDIILGFGVRVENPPPHPVT